MPVSARFHRPSAAPGPSPIWLEKIDYEPEEPEDEGHRRGRQPHRPADSPPNPARASQLGQHACGDRLRDALRPGPRPGPRRRPRNTGRVTWNPDPTWKEPVERIAQWQDEFDIVNVVVWIDDKLRQKQVTLTGTRPFFKDLVKKTSLDSGREIKVFLKPPSPPPASSTTAMTGCLAGRRAMPPLTENHPPARPTSADAFASPSDTARKDEASDADGNAGSGLGGDLQIERLLAYRDVHSWPPTAGWRLANRSMRPFIEVDPFRRPRTRRRRPGDG